MKERMFGFALLLAAVLVTGCSSVNTLDTSELTVQIVSDLPDSDRVGHVEVREEDGTVVASRRNFLNRLTSFDVPRGVYTIEGYIEHVVGNETHTVRTERTLTVQSDRDVVLDLTAPTSDLWDIPSNSVSGRRVTLLMADPLDSVHMDVSLGLAEVRFESSKLYDILEVESPLLGGSVGDGTYEFLPVYEGGRTPVVNITLDSYRACDGAIGTFTVSWAGYRVRKEHSMTPSPPCKG